MKGDRINKIFTNLKDCPKEKLITNKKIINLQGKTFNYLTVLYYVGSKNNRAEWLCHCNNCNRHVIVNSHNLKTGHTKSCGCLISQQLRKDLTNKTFGYLFVKSYAKSINENPYWNVKCTNCGKEYMVSGDALRQGQISCGCIKSKGEKIIRNFLIQHNVDFKTEVSFDDLRGLNNNKLRFDFGIYKNEKLLCLIEMQGIQHYYNIFNIPEKDWQRSILRDKEKKDFCINKKIPLYEITYNNNIQEEIEKIYHEALRCY